MSNSMCKIIQTCVPSAQRVIDRLHLQKLAYDAVQEIRIKHRWGLSKRTIKQGKSINDG